MDGAYIERLFDRLEGVCTMADGLSDAEVEGVEARYGFRFPPDLRALLQYRLPVSAGFPNWRANNDDVNEVEHRLSDPLESVLMNIGYGFWYTGWGERPADVIGAYELAFSQIPSVPLLIPVYGQCYLPASPFIEGNPVFGLEAGAVSLVATNLESYFEIQFLGGSAQAQTQGAGHIEFWGDLASQ